jgi:hypothetical protein
MNSTLSSVTSTYIQLRRMIINVKYFTNNYCIVNDSSIQGDRVRNVVVDGVVDRGTY